MSGTLPGEHILSLCVLLDLRLHDSDPQEHINIQDHGGGLKNVPIGVTHTLQVRASIVDSRRSPDRGSTTPGTGGTPGLDGDLRGSYQPSVSSIY